MPILRMPTRRLTAAESTIFARVRASALRAVAAAADLPLTTAAALAARAVDHRPSPPLPLRAGSGPAAPPIVHHGPSSVSLSLSTCDTSAVGATHQATPLVSLSLSTCDTSAVGAAHQAAPLAVGVAHHATPPIVGSAHHAVTAAGLRPDELLLLAGAQPSLLAALSRLVSHLRDGRPVWAARVGDRDRTSCQTRPSPRPGSDTCGAVSVASPGLARPAGRPRQRPVGSAAEH